MSTGAEGSPSLLSDTEEETVKKVLWGVAVAAVLCVPVALALDMANYRQAKANRRAARRHYELPRSEE